jgi:hypothetical protein
MAVCRGEGSFPAIVFHSLARVNVYKVSPLLSHCQVQNAVDSTSEGRVTSNAKLACLRAAVEEEEEGWAAQRPGLNYGAPHEHMPHLQCAVCSAVQCSV